MSTKKQRTRKKTYSRVDYVSGDGMLTAIWGPGLWHYMHTMSFNYPNNPSSLEKKYYKDFIIGLQYVLPCKYCRDNFKKNLLDYPLSMKHLLNRETFSKYVYTMHEMVNKRLNKQSGLSYTTIRDRYEHFRARCTIDKEDTSHKYIKIEKGCTTPLYGKKSKCLLKIVPQEEKSRTFEIDKKCIKTRN
jgi:hypothetical protein